MLDDRTDKIVKAELGTPRRLKTIYSVNMRTAYQREQYEQTMQSDIHPYFTYRTGPSKEHAEYNGLVLPKGDSFWSRHFPIKDYGCKCYTRALSEADFQRYKRDGVNVPPAADGTGGGTLRVKTQVPPETYTNYFNDRTLKLETVPAGVHPAFNWDACKAKRNDGAQAAFENAGRKYQEASGKPVPELASRSRIAEMQRVSDGFFKTLDEEALGNMSLYSEGGGPEVNHSVYSTDWENGPLAALIHSLDSTIAMYPALTAETWFFKGDNAASWTKGIIGKSISQKGFLSTSSYKSRAESYIDNDKNKRDNPFMVVIRAPKGTKGLYIGSNTAYNKNGSFKGNEYEYLFPRNTKFRVLDRSESHVVLEAIVE